jgi:hypothetical protein
MQELQIWEVHPILAVVLVVVVVVVLLLVDLGVEGHQVPVVITASPAAQAALTRVVLEQVLVEVEADIQAVAAVVTMVVLQVSVAVVLLIHQLHCRHLT